MSKDSTLILDDRRGDRLEYRDRTSGAVRWFAVKRHGNYFNRRLSKYLLYDNSGDIVKVLNTRWQVEIFIAEQEGTYANQERMLEYTKESRIVKVTAPWATAAEKKQWAKDYVEMVLGHSVVIRKARTVPPSDYYKVL